MKTITVSGTTLYHVAASQLGDATQWVRIAQLNGLSDPQIIGLVTLQIPDIDISAGGGVPAQS